MLLNHKSKIILAFRIGIVAALFVIIGFYVQYTSSIRFYGQFCITISDDEGDDVSEMFDVYGISYFGDTIDLFQKDGEFINCEDCYFTDLGLKYNYHFNDTVTVKYLTYSDNKSLECLYTSDDGENVMFSEYVNFNLLDKISSLYFVRIITILLIVVVFVLLYTFVLSKKILFFIKRNCKGKLFKSLVIPLILLVCFSVVIIFVFIPKRKQIAHQKEFNHSISYEYFPENVYDGYQIMIEDTSGNGLEFVFNLNDNFWFDSDSLISHIQNINVDDIYNEDKDIVRALEFVSSNTYHRYPSAKLMQNDFLQNPYLILNSSGYGICSDRTYAMCIILENMGYKTRVRNVKGLHTFPEIFDGDRWVLLDPDYGLLLMNNYGKIASLDEIKSQKNLVPNTILDNTFICNIENVVDTYPVRLEGIYNLDSLVSYSEITDKKLESTYFKLPPRSEITFPIYADSIGAYLFKVYIPGFYKGKLRIPLLINSIVNNENRETDSLIECGELWNDFDIVGTDMHIYAMINPLLFIPEKNKSVTLNYFTNNNFFPEIKISSRSSENDVFLAVSYLSELISENKLEYLTTTNMYLKILNIEMETWTDFEKIVAWHYRDKEYPFEKMELLENMFLSGDINENQFNKWIEQPGNISLILIMMDKCDNVNYFYKFKEYLEILKLNTLE